MKKGRRAEQPPSATLSSDSPSTPDENNMTDGFLDDFSSGMDLKTVPMKLKKVGGWADEATRSASSGKYVSFRGHSELPLTVLSVLFYELQKSNQGQPE